MQQTKKKPSMKRKIEESDDEASEMDEVEEDLSEGEILEPKPTSIQEKKKKKGTKLCKKFRQGNCHQGSKCSYLHKKKKDKQSDDTDQELLVKEDEKPKSLYAVVCLPYSLLI
jgi:hypothetical protein